MEKDKPNKKKQKKSTFKEFWRWPLIVLVTALALSFGFSVASQYALSGTGIAVSVVVIVVFIGISIVADIVGLAVTVADIAPFRAMGAKKVRGSKESIDLIKNADKVSSICADVIGDICGILSGAAGSVLTLCLLPESLGQGVEVLIASAVSAVIAALTIFGKALGKKYAIRNSEKITLILGKVVSLFCPQNPQKKKQHKKDKSQGEENEEKLNEKSFNE